MTIIQDNWDKISPHKSILLLSFLSALIRLWDLNARGLWFDEAFEYWAASVPLAHLPEVIRGAYQPPLYNLLLFGWVRLGSSEIWLRLPSVIFSLAAFLLILHWARRIRGNPGMLAAAALLLFLPGDIRYAQEAAEYAIKWMLLAFALFFLYRTAESKTIKPWLKWGIAGTLAVYAHYGAAIVILATGAAMLAENIWTKRYDQVKYQLSIGVGMAFAWTPLLLFLPSQISQQGTALIIQWGGWKEAFIFLRQTWEVYLFPFTGEPFSVFSKWFVFVPIVVILALSILILFRMHADSPAKRLITWHWAIFILYYTLVRTGFYGHGSFGFRHSLILMPTFILIAAIVITWLWKIPPGRLPAIILAGWFLIACLFSLPNRTASTMLRGQSAWPEIQDVRELMVTWNSIREPDTPAYVYYGAGLAFRYYAERMGLHPSRDLPPIWQAPCTHIPPADHCIEPPIYYGGWIRNLEPGQKIDSIFTSFGYTPESFWLIFSHIYLNEDQLIIEALEDRYVIVDQLSGQNAVFYLLDSIEK